MAPGGIGSGRMALLALALGAVALPEVNPSAQVLDLETIVRDPRQEEMNQLVKELQLNNSEQGRAARRKKTKAERCDLRGAARCALPKGRQKGPAKQPKRKQAGTHNRKRSR